MNDTMNRRPTALRWLPAIALLASCAVCAQTPVVDGDVLDGAALSHTSGEQIYRHICQGCHMPDGRGATGAGKYPALASDPHLSSASFMAAVVLNGRGDMPSFVPRPDLNGFEALVRVGLDDAQIADVVNYVRSHFGNHYLDKLTAEDVHALHAAKAGSP